jgi:hypothetical protein
MSTGEEKQNKKRKRVTGPKQKKHGQNKKNKKTNLKSSPW